MKVVWVNKIFNLCFFNKLFILKFMVWKNYFFGSEKKEREIDIILGDYVICMYIYIF